MATNPKLVEDAVTMLGGDHKAAARKLQGVMDVAPVPHYTVLRETATPDDVPEVGEVRWVRAFGRQRRGIVVKVARLKSSVAWVAPSTPDDIKVVADVHGQVTREKR